MHKRLITFRTKVITFRTLLHLGPNVITFRTLLHLGQLLHLGLQQPLVEHKVLLRVFGFTHFRTFRLSILQGLIWDRFFFVLSRAWDKEKILSRHKETNEWDSEWDSEFFPCPTLLTRRKTSLYFFTELKTYHLCYSI